MAIDTNNNNPISDEDDEPTIELERLSEETCARFLQPDDASEIRELREELNFRVEMNGILQHGLDQQRGASQKLQQEITRLEKVNEKITEELKQCHEQLKKTKDKLAKSRRREQSLHTELEGLTNAGAVDAVVADQERAIEALREDNSKLEDAVADLETRLASTRQENDDLRQAVASKRTPEDTANGVSLETPRTNGSQGKSHWVLVELDGGQADTYVVGDGLVTIGSDPDSDIRIKSKFISRRHAQLLNNGGSCVLDDLDSTNGTFINARRVNKRLLRAGDIVTIGKHRFRYEQRPARTDAVPLTAQE